MSSLGTSKGILEIAKFAIYVTVPIGMMYFFASNTKNLQKVMGNELIVGGVNFMVKSVVNFCNFIFLVMASSAPNLLKNFFFFARQYVVYPPEGPRPPSPEELREMAREIARKREKN